MMKTRILLLFTLLAIHPAIADDFEDLEALVGRYVQSIEKLDIEVAKSIWSQDEEISFIQPKGHQRSWEEIQERFYGGAMGNFSERTLAVSDLAIHVLDETSAWGVFYWEFRATFKDGEKITTKGRETQIWKKEGDAWKIVHVHYSNMPVTGEREGF
jgi:ketosteroid isomerase-like protein